jgi:alkyl sulfatase BDS1-like metallo-beta-lactamase superfamily hydrolase
LLDYLGVRLNGPAAAAHTLHLNLIVTDRDELWHVGVEHGALHTIEGRHVDGADATVSLPYGALRAVGEGTASLDDLIAAGEISVEGDVQAFHTLLGLLDEFELWFDIVTP